MRFQNAIAKPPYFYQYLRDSWNCAHSSGYNALMEPTLLKASVADMRTKGMTEVSIASYLAEMGLTSPTIATGMGVTPKTITNWVKGTHRPIADIRKENHARRKASQT